MQHARTTLAVVAFAAVVGCTVKAPASTPTTVQSRYQLYSTESTYAFTRDLLGRYADHYANPVIELGRRQFTLLLTQLDALSIDYFTSSHVPAREDFWAAPLAMDGLAIIVNRGNQLENLALDDLADIFTGRIIDWRAVGGNPGKIVPLTVQSGSDSYHELQRMVLGKTGITGNAQLVPGFEAMLQQVAQRVDAIGYLPYSAVDSRVKVIRVDGVRPDARAIRDRIYPLRSTIYVIGRQEPSPAFYNFFSWIQSEAGQALVAESLIALP